MVMKKDSEDHALMRLVKLNESDYISDPIVHPDRATKDMFSYKRDKDPKGLDLADLVHHSRQRKKDWRISSKEADRAAVASMVILLDGKLAQLGNQWQSCCLGGEGHLYRQVMDNKVYISFGVESDVALMWGPLREITRGDQIFYTAKGSTMQRHWAVLYNIDHPNESELGIDAEEWHGVPSCTHVPDDVTQADLIHYGMLKLKVGADQTLIRFVLLECVKLSPEELRKLVKLFKIKCKRLPNHKSVDTSARVVALVTHVLADLSAPEQTAAIMKYMASLRKQQTLDDDESLLEVIEALDVDSRAEFGDIERKLKVNQIDKLADLKVSAFQARLAQNKKSAKENSTSPFLRELAPVNVSKCRVVEDVKKTSFEGYNPMKTGSRCHGCSRSFSHRSKAEALAEVVDWIWDMHKKAGNDDSARPTHDYVEAALIKSEQDAAKVEAALSSSEQDVAKLTGVEIGARGTILYIYIYIYILSDLLICYW